MRIEKEFYLGKCPACSSYATDHGDIIPDECDGFPAMVEERSCLDCGAKWVDHYALTHAEYNPK